MQCMQRGKNRSCENFTTFTTGAVWHRDEVIRVRGRKVKSRGQSKTRCGRINDCGGILSPIFGMHGRILAYHSHSLPGPHDTGRRHHNRHTTFVMRLLQTDVRI